jgi:hypothetical protein
LLTVDRVTPSTTICALPIAGPYTVHHVTEVPRKVSDQLAPAPLSWA